MLRAYIAFLLAAAFLASFFSVGAERSEGTAEPQAPLQPEATPAESDDAYQVAAPDGVEIRRREDGHFYADVSINGISVNVLVDTGATAIALTRDDARRVGLAVSPRMDMVVGRGASGDVQGEFVQLDRVELGRRSADKVPAVVLDSGRQSLLGQNFLKEFQSVEIEGDTMLLR